MGPVHQTDPTKWWRAWEVNVKGSYLPTHYALNQRFAHAPVAPANPELTIIFVSYALSSRGAHAQLIIPQVYRLHDDDAGLERLPGVKERGQPLRRVRARRVRRARRARIGNPSW